MSSFCHLVIISTNYILKNVGETGQPWHTHLLLLATFDNLELNVINISFCVSVSTIVFNNEFGRFLDLKCQIQSVFVYYQMLFYNLYTRSLFPNYITVTFKLILQGKILYLCMNVL